MTNTIQRKALRSSFGAKPICTCLMKQVNPQLKVQCHPNKTYAMERRMMVQWRLARGPGFLVLEVQVLVYCRHRIFGALQSTSSKRKLCSGLDLLYSISFSRIHHTFLHTFYSIATSKKRLVPDAKQSLDVTKRSTNKRTKRGMNDAVARALEQCGDLL